MNTATTPRRNTPGRVPILGDLVLADEATAHPIAHKVPITLDGPYPKRLRRVVRARRTWSVALVVIAVTLSLHGLRHFMG